MATYKIAGKIQKVTYDASAKFKSVSIEPDQEYSLKNGDKKYAMLMPDKDNAFQALAVEYKKEIEFEFKPETSISLETGKRMMAKLSYSSCDAIKAEAKKIEKASEVIKEEVDKTEKTEEAIKIKTGEISTNAEAIKAETGKISEAAKAIAGKVKERKSSVEIIEEQLEIIYDVSQCVITLKSDAIPGKKGLTPSNFKLAALSLLA